MPRGSGGTLLTQFSGNMVCFRPADRCCYVLYSETPIKKSPIPSSDRSSGNLEKQRFITKEIIDDAIDLLIDPIAGSPARGKKVVGVACLHVADLFFTGGQELEKRVLENLRKDFQVGSEDKNDIVFTGQRVKKSEKRIEVDQQLAIEELEEVPFDKSL